MSRLSRTLTHRCPRLPPVVGALPSFLPLRFFSSAPGLPPPAGAAPRAASRPHGPNDPAAVALRASILAAALKHVPRCGWQDALAAGAEELGYPAVAASLLPGGAVELVWHEMREAQAAMNAALGSADLAALPVNARIALAVRARLAHFGRHRGAWAGAMALGAAPAALPTTLALLAAAADDAWWAAGDRSVDSSWYTRRALLMGVSAATEVFMLTDHSPDHQDSWAFLERRLGELSTLSQRSLEGAALAGAAGAGLAAIAEGVMGTLVRPRLMGRDGEGLARCLPTIPASLLPAAGPAQALNDLLQAAEGAARAAGLPSPTSMAELLVTQLMPKGAGAGKVPGSSSSSSEGRVQ